ncbi:MAG: hypothetical protein QXS04_01600 [Thermoproteota archaeon]
MGEGAQHVSTRLGENCLTGLKKDVFKPVYAEARRFSHRMPEANLSHLPPHGGGKTYLQPRINTAR